MNFFSSIENGSSCSSTPSDWFRIAVLDCAAFGHQHVAAEGRVGRGDRRCCGRHVGDHAAAGVRRSCRRTTSARARSGRRRAGRRGTPARWRCAPRCSRACWRRPRLRGHHPAVASLALLQLDLPAAARQQLRRCGCAAASGVSASARLGAGGGRPAGCSRTDAFLVGLQVGARSCGVLRAMHSEVLTTRKARISRNHQAL